MLPGYRQKMYQKSLGVHVKVIPETVDNDCMIIISSWVSNMSIVISDLVEDGDEFLSP